MAHNGEPRSSGRPAAVPLSDHYIVYGGNALAHRLTVELVEHYDVPVVAVVPDRTEDHAPQIEQLRGVAAFIESKTFTDEVLRDACARTARGIALVDGEDQVKIHAAMCAQRHNPRIRIVLRMFNQRLGRQTEDLLTNCASLSGSATAGPAFANGALGHPHSVQVGDRFVYVAHDGAIRPDHLCVVADRIDRHDLSRIRLMPEETSRAADFISLAARSGAQVALRPGGEPAEPGTPGTGGGDGLAAL
jgi:hypothetical protein